MENNNSRKKMIMALTLASVFLFACTQVPAALAAIGDPTCIATTAQNIVDIVNYCGLPVVPATGAPPNCCAAAQNFDFSCSCSPFVVDLAGLQSVITFRDLLTKLNYCNMVTFQQGLACLASLKLP